MQQSKKPLIPKLLSLCMSLGIDTTSKALAKSQSRISTQDRLFNEIVQLFTHSKRLVTVERRFKKTCWSIIYCSAIFLVEENKNNKIKSIIFYI